MKNILVVDDEKNIREILEDYISQNMEGCKIDFSEDGIDAFFKCSFQKFDAIILDHQMPRMNGLDLLVSLRNNLSLNHLTPIFIISGILPKIDEKLTVFKNTYFLQKPFNFDELKEHLESSMS